MENTNIKDKIVGGIVVLILLVGMYSIYRSQPSVKNLVERGDVASTTETQATSTTFTNNGGLQVKVGATGNYKIEEVPINEGRGIPQPIPDLSRAVSFGSSVSADAKTAILNKIFELQVSLKKQANFPAGWLDLGLYYKMAGDYTGAISSWEYVTRLSPEDFVARGNLGNLYAYYLHDFVRAEMYYKSAIIHGPTQAYLYVQYADVYKEVAKDTAGAKQIIEQGLAKIPNDPALLEYKKNLEK